MITALTVVALGMAAFTLIACALTIAVATGVALTDTLVVELKRPDRSDGGAS